MTQLRTSEAGLKLIMTYEGFRSLAKKQSNGRWVIGYGHTKAAREGVKVSQEEANAILREFDLPPIEDALNDLLLVPVSQNEFDALASFTFNIGVDQFETSDVLALINAGEKLKAAMAMESWRKARVGARDMVVDPLVRRRADEKALFLKTIGSVPLASSSSFRPLIDLDDDFSLVKAAAGSAFEAPGHPANDQIDEETSTETAARHVKDRLTRILGEDRDVFDDEDDLVIEPDERSDDEARSVEDIRAAVSALAVEDRLEADETQTVEDLSDDEPEAGSLPAMSADNDSDEVDLSDEDEPAGDAATDPVISDEDHRDETVTDDADIEPSAVTPAYYWAENTATVAAKPEDTVTSEPADEIEHVAVDEDKAYEDATDAEDDADESADESQLETDAFDVEGEALTVAETENVDERGRIIIDDLRPSDVWLSEGKEEAENKKEGPLEVFLFGILSLIGAGLFAYGGSREFGWFGVEQADQADLMAYLPPFLMLIGGMLFVVMAYYCIKALVSRN